MTGRGAMNCEVAFAFWRAGFESATPLRGVGSGPDETCSGAETDNMIGGRAVATKASDSSAGAMNCEVSFASWTAGRETVTRPRLSDSGAGACCSVRIGADNDNVNGSRALAAEADNDSFTKLGSS